MTKQALGRWFYRTFLVHPTENRFGPTDFVAELERRGIQVEGRLAVWFFGDFFSGAGRVAPE